jgi:hypothetical protein
MAEKPVDRAYEWTVDEIAGVVKRLKIAAEVFEDFQSLAESTPTKTLASHNRLTLIRALANLDSALGAIQKSIWLCRSGTPLETGQLKPKSVLARTTNKKGKKDEPATKRAKTTRDV